MHDVLIGSESGVTDRIIDWARQERLEANQAAHAPVCEPMQLRGRTTKL